MLELNAIGKCPELGNLMCMNGLTLAVLPDLSVGLKQLETFCCTTLHLCLEVPHWLENSR